MTLPPHAMSVDVEDGCHDGAGDDRAARGVDHDSEALLAHFADAALDAHAKRYAAQVSFREAVPEVGA